MATPTRSRSSARKPAGRKSARTTKPVDPLQQILSYYGPKLKWAAIWLVIGLAIGLLIDSGGHSQAHQLAPSVVRPAGHSVSRVVADSK